MSLSGLALSLERARKERGSLEKRIWKLVAFLARYGHQPAPAVLGMPVDRLEALACAVGDLLDAEAEASKPKE